MDAPAPTVRGATDATLFSVVYDELTRLAQRQRRAVDADATRLDAVNGRMRRVVGTHRGH
jgi:hypothetical protein